MARANAAYYATHDPFADFTTSPEITQMFGELLGAWAAVCWDQMGRPDPVLLVEAGPGRGTLMADALRLIARVAPDFSAALRVHLIETSPRLRAEQALRLPDASWCRDLAELPNGPMILLANEFLDALPIRQFIRHDVFWAERYVQDAHFTEHPAIFPPPLEGGAGGGVTTRTDAPLHDTPPPIVEQGEAAAAWTTTLAARLATQGGAALLLDYGPAQSAPGDSLQALRSGRPANPLADPGTADLTAHVDFSALARCARVAGATVHGPIAQGALLERLGLFARARQLAASQPPAEALATMDAANRLAQPERMGALFKALAISHPALPAPPGFAP